MTNFERNWNRCIVGKCTIWPDGLDRPSHVWHGRVRRSEEDARKYVAARPKLAEQFKLWHDWKDAEVARWKHETPHFRYIADRGAIALRVNGARVLVGNHHGDGSFPVYVVRDGSGPDKYLPPAYPPTFNFSGTSVDGPCRIEIMDYDCGDSANVLEAIDLGDGESVGVLTERTGAVVIEICGRSQP